MPQFIVVTLEKDLPAAMAVYAKPGPGRSLARESDRLDSAARAKGVYALTALLSESPAALAEQMRSEGFDPGKMRLPPEQWYDAAEGLKTVRALTEYVTSRLNDFKFPNPILRDLKAIELLLTEAEAAKIKFHFSKVVT